MKKVLSVVLGVFMFSALTAQENLNYFLPEDVTFNSDIPTPEDYFNQQIGEWHLTHDQILSYAKEIARTSDRAILYEYARSYENRPLVHLVFTSAENQKKLDELKQAHYNFSEPGSDIPKDEVPLVVSLTYGVHGNESSGPNASVLTAYYLAAAQGENIDKLLNETVVIVDPCLNPDGFTRHSTWANMHQSSVPNGNNDSRQFQEVWPGGRTNHYWFDLNRDYLLLVHPESRGRVAKFHEWKPNIVTDHHEMGANSTFFFQPGVPSRNNPLTPERNYELTREIASYHAKYLDKIGSTYFSEEQFDDYYFGKGSSYPDLNGSVGILFEQAGFRGRIRETSNGTRKLSFAIKNQFTVTLSTLDAAVNLHDELLDMQKDFYREGLELAAKSSVKAYVFGNELDRIKTQMFVDLLNRHHIEVYKNEKDLVADNTEFKAESSFIVPAEQKQYRLIQTIFEEVTSFNDTTFYDVSTWAFTHAFDMPFARIHSAKGLKYSDSPVKPEIIKGIVKGGKSIVGYLFRWNEYTAPNALYQLQKEGLTTKVATDSLCFEINGAEENFSFGTIAVPATGQKKNADQIYNMVCEIAEKTGIDFYGLSTGLSPKGIDMGSGSFMNLNQPEILLFVGGSANSRDAGEIWHLFDQRYKIPVTLTETDNMGKMNLDKYNTIILAGNFREWSNNEVQKLKNWVSQGGNLIAYKDAANWAAKHDIGRTKFKNEVDTDTTKYLKYSEQNKERNLNTISGAIFKAKIDITHPLCYGYKEEELSVFKTGTSAAISLGTKYAEPVIFTSDPYISGWISEGNLNRIKNAPIVSVQSIGRGKLISYYENMNFRGIWLGTSKLFSNAIFFGSIIR